MSAATYLGDEVSGAGWRLAGVDARTTAAGQETAALAAARAESEMVLVSAALAGRIDAPALRAALAALRPLVLLVPDLVGDAALPDLAARLRAQLGMEA